jgi:GDP-mannose transporter
VQQEVIGSVLLISMGAIVAGYYDLEFHLKSYAWAMVSCVLGAGNLTMMKLVSTSKEQATAPEILFANSSLCVAFLLVYGLLSGEFHEALQFPELGTVSFLASLVGSSLMGASLGFGQLLCTRANSALTTSMVGQMKAVFSTIFGAMLFGTALQSLQVLGIVLNTIGARPTPFMLFPFPLNHLTPSKHS